VISLVEDLSARRNTVQEFAKSVFWTPLFFLTKWLTGNCWVISWPGGKTTLPLDGEDVAILELRN
jgi:hypothetical protein